MAADQLDNFARVADGPVGEQEEQPGVSAEHRLPQDPVERIQDVGASHVSSDLSNILTSQSQGILGCGNKEEKRSKWFMGNIKADAQLYVPHGADDSDNLEIAAVWKLPQLNNSNLEILSLTPVSITPDIQSHLGSLTSNENLLPWHTFSKTELKSFI